MILPWFSDMKDDEERKSQIKEQRNEMTLLLLHA